jgi:hypothetical protein
VWHFSIFIFFLASTPISKPQLPEQSGALSEVEIPKGAKPKYKLQKHIAFISDI